MRFWSKLDRILVKILNKSAFIGGSFIFATAVLVSYEVLMRYVFASPSLWTFDVTIFLILYSAYIGSGYNLKEGKHVSVEFLVERLAKYKRFSLALGALTNLVGIVFWIIVSWKAFEEGIMAYRLSEVTLSYLRFPLTIPLLAVFLGSLLILVQTLRELVRQVAGLAGRGPG